LFTWLPSWVFCRFWRIIGAPLSVWGRNQGFWPFFLPGELSSKRTGAFLNFCASLAAHVALPETVFRLAAEALAHWHSLEGGKMRRTPTSAGTLLMKTNTAPF
jgi:hypothetical protein